MTETRLAEVLAALSFALDLTEGQPGGHTLRSALVGMALGERAGLGEADLTDLYHALLLKDIGCSANASRTSALLGADDRAVKPALKLTDSSTWRGRAAGMLRAGRDGGALTRARAVLALARGNGYVAALIRLRCERGGQITADLGFRPAVGEAICALDEHWDGEGEPDRLRGDAIPRPSCIMLLAQTAEIVTTARGAASALDFVRRRSGTWFDPALVRHLDAGLLGGLPRAEAALVAAAVERAPGPASTPATDIQLTQLAHAFAEVVDGKSPWTARHSHRVAAVVSGIADEMGHAGGCELVRTALLHDIGTLGVSSRILDKAGPLTRAEWEEVRRHAAAGSEILARVKPFAPLATATADHHERPDGSGYPRGIEGADVALEARLLGVADAYESLTAGRAYRPPIAPAQAVGRLRKDAGTRLDRDCVDALAEFVAAS